MGTFNHLDSEKKDSKDAHATTHRSKRARTEHSEVHCTSFLGILAGKTIDSNALSGVATNLNGTTELERELPDGNKKLEKTSDQDNDAFFKHVENESLESDQLTISRADQQDWTRVFEGIENEPDSLGYKSLRFLERVCVTRSTTEERLHSSFSRCENVLECFLHSALSSTIQLVEKDNEKISELFRNITFLLTSNHHKRVELNTAIDLKRANLNAALDGLRCRLCGCGEDASLQMLHTKCTTAEDNHCIASSRKDLNPHARITDDPEATDWEELMDHKPWVEKIQTFLGAYKECNTADQKFQAMLELVQEKVSESRHRAMGAVVSTFDKIDCELEESLTDFKELLASNFTRRKELAACIEQASVRQQSFLSKMRDRLSSFTKKGCKASNI